MVRHPSSSSQGLQLPVLPQLPLAVMVAPPAQEVVAVVAMFLNVAAMVASTVLTAGATVQELVPAVAVLAMEVAATAPALAPAMAVKALCNVVLQLLP